MLNKFAKSFHIPGALTANLNIRFAVSAPCSLTHVSAVGSNANDATMSMGTSSDVDGFLSPLAIGDSDVPEEVDRASFDGALLAEPGKENPRLADGDIFVCTIDYDGAGGTAAQNVTLVFEFTEG